MIYCFMSSGEKPVVFLYSTTVSEFATFRLANIANMALSARSLDLLAHAPEMSWRWAMLSRDPAKYGVFRIRGPRFPIYKLTLYLDHPRLISAPVLFKSFYNIYTNFRGATAPKSQDRPKRLLPDGSTGGLVVSKALIPQPSCQDS